MTGNLHTDDVHAQMLDNLARTTDELRRLAEWLAVNGPSLPAGCTIEYGAFGSITVEAPDVARMIEATDWLSAGDPTHTGVEAVTLFGVLTVQRRWGAVTVMVNLDVERIGEWIEQGQLSPTTAEFRRWAARILANVNGVDLLGPLAGMLAEVAR